MSALDELKAMIREKGGNTNVSSLAEALREYNKYDDGGGSSEGPLVVTANIVANEDPDAAPQAEFDVTNAELYAAITAHRAIMLLLRWGIEGGPSDILAPAIASAVKDGDEYTINVGAVLFYERFLELSFSNFTSESSAADGTLYSMFDITLYGGGGG